MLASEPNHVIFDYTHATTRSPNALFIFLALPPSVLVELLEILDALLWRTELAILFFLRLRS